MSEKHFFRDYGPSPRFGIIHLILALIIFILIVAGLYFLIYYDVFYIAVAVISLLCSIYEAIAIMQINWGIRHSCCTTAVISEYIVHTRRMKHQVPYERYVEIVKYTPVLHYQTEDGTEIRSAHMPSSEHKKYREGESVIIQYLPNFPKICYFSENEQELVKGYWLRFFIFAGVFIFSFFFLLGGLLN